MDSEWMSQTSRPISTTTNYRPYHISTTSKNNNNNHGHLATIYLSINSDQLAKIEKGRAVLWKIALDAMAVCRFILAA